ncbi:expressed unknown protein [Seminavis robusta]|uniref:Uncharacterized protein n=1 Tax=Seminavis robusta TaxID=568900 RepID=A0A9N8EE42_9STRA|nr:expressed unknown protein [Seminavis robusta]|eukprot:Sro943_g222770.1 n/a (171) ;mRNA; f:15328-15938
MGLMDTHHESLKLSFQDANWTCETSDEITLRETTSTSSKVTWEYGLDISFGTKIDSPIEGVTNVDYSFEVVRPGLLSRKGYGIYGKPEAVHIYTGTITFADPTQPHIEYDMNSFTFLLDEGQPEGVTVEDHGRAIAIHAGGHPTLSNRNIAFKLTEEMELAAEAQQVSLA